MALAPSCYFESPFAGPYVSQREDIATHQVVLHSKTGLRDCARVTPTMRLRQQPPL